MEIASSGGLQEVECPGAGDHLRAALHPQLATEVIDVSLHRVHTQHEAAGDLTIRCSRKQQPQHLAFAFGQRFHKRIKARRGGKSRGLLLTESGEQGGAFALGRDLESFLLVELSRDKIVFVEEGVARVPQALRQRSRYRGLLERGSSGDRRPTSSAARPTKR